MCTTPALVLASASPRRVELLSRLGMQFAAQASNVAEDELERSRRPELVARRLARAKAVAVASDDPAASVLAADTIVVLRGRLFGKPDSPEEAIAMLRSLRARSHRVITAVALARGGRLLVRHATTWVTMRDYTDEEIWRSIERGDPFDKAGAYAIQDESFRPVAGSCGCYCNVVGLPLALVAELLAATPVDWSGNAGGARMELPSACACCPLWSSPATPDVAPRHHGNAKAGP
jgi:MAF protein